MRRRSLILIGIGAAGFLVLAAVWYLASPLFINRSVDEASPLDIPSQAEMEAMSESELSAAMDEVLSTAASMPDKSMDDPMPDAAEPVVLRSGSFVDADSFHRGSGMALILELEGGEQVLRLENFNVTNGPDLHVYLAGGLSPVDSESMGATLDLGALKGNVGNQNYDIPAGVDLAAFNSVVIYCVPFHVVFSTAALSN